MEGDFGLPLSKFVNADFESAADSVRGEGKFALETELG